MKAVAISEFNTDPAVQDLPVPEAGEGEVVVDVEWSSVNGMDAFTVNGVIANMMPAEFPITLGRDFSGTVAAVGGGVTDLAVGDPVFGMLMSYPLHEGTWGERAKVPTYSLAKRPDGLSAKDAGSIAVAGAAAKLAVDALELKGGETVLINGATGGVGAFAVQFAKARGATVIATAKPGKADFVKGLGADEAVDYTGDLAAAVRAVAPDGIDCAIHCTADPQPLADLLKPGGRLTSVLGAGPNAFEGQDVQATAIQTIPNPQLVAELAAAVVSGDVKVPITQTYGLADAGKAIDAFNQGALGKYAVQVK